MIEIVRIGEDFTRFEELLALILSSFAYMDGIIDPPSSAHRLTPQSLAEKAGSEIAFVAVEKGALLGCIFCKPEDGALLSRQACGCPFISGQGPRKAAPYNSGRHRIRDGPACIETGNTHRTCRQPRNLRPLGIYQDGRKRPCRLHPANLDRDAQGSPDVSFQLRPGSTRLGGRWPSK